MAISVVNYLHFLNRTLCWNSNNVMHNHIMVKTELQFVSNMKLEQYGLNANKQAYTG